MYKHMEDIKEFDELKNSETTLIVDFFATWCGPCKMLAPELEELCEEHKDVNVLSIDVDKFPELAGKFNIRVVPTMIFFRKGEKFNQVSGYMDKDAVFNLTK